MSDPTTPFGVAVEVTKVGGPYTVIVALAWAVRYLYQARERDKEKHDADKQALNDRIVKVLETQYSTLTVAVNTQQRQSDALAQSLINQQAIIEVMKKR